MANKRIKRKCKPNIFEGGGPVNSNFMDFLSSDKFKNMSALIQGVNQGTSQGQNSFLSMNSGSKGSGLLGAIGGAVDTTGQAFSAIDNMLTKKRKPLGKTVGLYSRGGRLYFGGGGMGGSGGMGAGSYMDMGTTAIALAGNALQQAEIADTTDLQEGIKQFGNSVPSANTNDELMNEWSQRKELSHISYKDLRNKSLFGDFANSLSASGQGFSAGSSAGPWGAAIGGIVGGVSSVVGSIFGRSKAKKKARKINRKIDEANQRTLTSLENRASTIDRQSDLNLLANYSAYGGPIEGPIDYNFMQEDLDNERLNAMAQMKLTSLPNYGYPDDMQDINSFAKGGGIHIKKKNRGKFTEYCGGKVTDACIQKGLHSNNPTTRKRANFARNARKWHAEGGWLDTHGGTFTNRVSIIEEGGTHEENPNQGVQMGVDSQGVPNLVEQGEVVYDDYVFSNRIEVPRQLKKKYRLKGVTFADAARGIQKESSERPNDPISNNGLKAGMSRLAEAQEALKAYQQQSQSAEAGHLYATGGEREKPLSIIPLGDDFLSRDYSLATRYTTNEEEGFKGRPTWMRYAPVVGSGIGVIADLFSSPDYSNADMITASTQRLTNVPFTPLGNYLDYRPLDRDFYLNRLGQNAAATRRSITNTSGGNRLNAQAGILAADYNYGASLGQFAREAEEYNRQQQERVEAFNRGTNQYNSEAAMRAAIANKQNDELRFRSAAAAAQMREAIRQQEEARRSANISNFLQGLGDIGWENEQANWLDNSADQGVFKINTKGEYTGNKKSTKSNSKKKKGYTYG